MHGLPLRDETVDLPPSDATVGSRRLAFELGGSLLGAVVRHRSPPPRRGRLRRLL
jgi:hypothetical protein